MWLNFFLTQMWLNFCLTQMWLTHQKPSFHLKQMYLAARDTNKISLFHNFLKNKYTRTGSIDQKRLLKLTQALIWYPLTGATGLKF